MSQSLITDYENYQNEYNNKCQEWRAEPVYNRRCNDVGCVVVFFVIFGAFLAGGIYYISQAKNISVDIQTNTVISDHWSTIVVGLLVSIVASYLYILLVRAMPRVMVYTLMVLSLALLLGLAIVGFAIGQIGLGIPCLIIFLVYTLVLVCLRSKIRLGIVLIKVAAQFIKQRCGVFLAPIVKLFLTFLFTAIWLYTLACIWSVANDKTNRKEDNTAQGVVTVLWVFVYLLMGFLFYYMTVFTIAVACSFWYYDVQGNYFAKAYKWLFTSAFGSIAFAAIIISVVRFARLLIDSQRRRTRNIAVAICLCLVSMCLRNLQNLLNILNHNSVIVMSVTGQGFIPAAKTTIGILSRFLPLLSVADIITGLLVFWGIVVVAGISGFVSWVMMNSTNATSSDIGYVIAIVVIGSIVVSSMVFSVLVEAMSSVFIFYCFDTRFRQLGYATHNMPPEIVDALNGYVK